MNPKGSAGWNCLFKPDICLICPVLTYQVLLFIIIVTLLIAGMIQPFLTLPATCHYGDFNYFIADSV